MVPQRLVSTLWQLLFAVAGFTLLLIASRQVAIGAFRPAAFSAVIGAACFLCLYLERNYRLR